MARQLMPPAFHKAKTLDNKYMLGDEIGKGAYGRVYKGLDLENGDFVAIKQVSLENIAQEDLNIIMQEIDLLKNLNHKNIVKYLGSLKAKTHLFIILEYVENGSLATIIKPNKFGPFPESLVAVYITQVLEGLVYLHEQGVIHRDIKGANILTTKEGLVKLADFGVATKLTEADVNTHSVVGTPYWMAPEVIEMSGVCAASDIWSVGCTVIELLTCVPPYFDLQPMPALFRIVQDEHPPIPDGLSPDITHFLRQCFKKDPRQRPDAKTLLSNPWIQNCRRALQSSLRHSGSIRNIEEDDLEDAEISTADRTGTGGSSSMREIVVDSDRKAHSEKVTLTEDPACSKPNDDMASDSNTVKEKAENSHVEVDQVLTLAIPVNSPRSVSGRLSSSKELAIPESELPTVGDCEVAVMNGDMTSPASKGIKVGGKYAGKDNATKIGNKSFGFGPRGQDSSSPQAMKMSVPVEGNELSKFSDSPCDGSLDDLFPPEVSSASASQANKADTPANDTGKKDLAPILRATIARKQMVSENGQANGGGNFFRRLMLGVLENDIIDINGLDFDENLPGENISPFQAVEFSKLVGSLRSEESEDVIVSACQKLTAIFHQREEQKIVFVRQHGFLPLLELLEVPKTSVICCVLQLINKIIKDNTDFQENACLIGLIPLVMSFAVPDRPREIRMEAAYILQQLCHSSSLTLQMFIACRGISVIVGFLEADYAKYREMVHLAVDGMWQVFKLQRSTPTNDFCRIAAKNGILLRLINTLYSLNEATRLVSIASGFPADGSSQQVYPDSLDDDAHFLQDDIPQSGARHLPVDVDRPQSNIISPEATFVEKISAPATEESAGSASKDVENVDGRKTDASQVNHELRQLRSVSFTNRTSMDFTNRTSMDRPTKLSESASNGFSTTAATQQEQVRPLLSLLDKEPPSRRFSDSSQWGRGNGNTEATPKVLQKTVSKKVWPLTSHDGAASTSGVASQTASSVLSGSGVLNAGPDSVTSSGVLANMVSTLNTDVAREYLEKVADLLLEFAQADTTVKSCMCSQSLLSRLLQMFNRVEPPILFKILKCINYLSTDPNCLENLQRADAIKYLIPNLELKEGSLVYQIHLEVLSALFNLCKINKRRQDQAAEGGIIPHLMEFISSNSPLKQYALPLLCDIAHASRNSREQLRAHGGLDVYLNLLEDDVWSVTALDSISVCLAHDNDNRKVEQALLKKDAVQKLVKFFRSCPEQHFVHTLETFLKIITKSPRINTTLAVNGLTSLLIARLDHQDAIARLNLLKLIKVVYEHHPRPKQLIVENDLPQKLQNLIEERRDGQSSGRQVLVKQMATSLLKALHINTVL